MKIKYAYVLIMLAAIGFAATSAQAVLTYTGNEFTQAVNDNWTEDGNWWYSEEGVGDYPGAEPVSGQNVVLGSPDHMPVTCTIYTGTAAVAGELNIGGYYNFGVDVFTGTGTLVIQQGASLLLDGGDSRVGGGRGNDGSTDRLEVYGSLTVSDMINIGEFGRAQLLVAEGASVTTGRVNFGHGGYMADGFSYEATIEAGATWTNNGGGFYVSGGAGLIFNSGNRRLPLEDGTLGPHYLRLEDGATIQSDGTNGYTGQSFWLMGGTLEIAGGATLNVTGGPCNLGVSGAGPDPSMEAYPVIKFVGSQGTAVLTTTGTGYNLATAPFDYPGCRTAFLDDGGTTSCYINVDDLIPTSNDWEIIVQTEEMLPGSVTEFVAGTDPLWEIRLTDGALGTIEVKWNGPIDLYQLGDMDGSDGATEPNGNDINPFVLALVDRPAYELAYPGLDADLRGDCNQMADGLNGNDINPFVDFLLHGGPGYNHIPEPASALLLLVGLAGLVRRRMRR